MTAQGFVDAGREIMRRLGVVIPVAGVAQRGKAGHVDLRECGRGWIDKRIVHPQSRDIKSLRAVVIEIRESVVAVPHRKYCRWIDGENTIHRSRIHPSEEPPTGLG